MKYILILVHLIFSTVAHASAVLSGIVIDTADHPLAYVNIGIPNTSTGTVSDIYGQFKLVLDTSDSDSMEIRFSSVGYATKIIKVCTTDSNVSRHLRIILIPIGYDIPVIEITSDAFQVKIKGNTNYDARMQNNMAISDQPDQNLGMALGRKFRLGNKVAKFSKFRFYISHNDFDTIQVRVGFSTIVSGMPGVPINCKPVIKEIVNSYEGWVEVDLDPYNIMQSGSIIATIEWVGCSSEGSYLTMPITVPAPGAIHFYRYGSQNKWKRYPGMSVAMNLEIRITDQPALTSVP